MNQTPTQKPTQKQPKQKKDKPITKTRRRKPAHLAQPSRKEKALFHLSFAVLAIWLLCLVSLLRPIAETDTTFTAEGPEIAPVSRLTPFDSSLSDFNSATEAVFLSDTEQPVLSYPLLATPGHFSHVASVGKFDSLSPLPTTARTADPAPIIAEPTPITAEATPTAVEPDTDTESDQEPEFVPLDIPLDAEYQRRTFEEVCDRDVDWFILLMSVANQETDKAFKLDLIGDEGRSYGIYQINTVWHMPRANKYGITEKEQLFDPVQAAYVAKDYIEGIKSSLKSIQMDTSVKNIYVTYNAGHYTTNETVQWRADKVVDYYEAFYDEFTTANPQFK